MAEVQRICPDALSAEEQRHMASMFMGARVGEGQSYICPAKCPGAQIKALKFAGVTFNSKPVCPNPELLAPTKPQNTEIL